MPDDNSLACAGAATLVTVDPSAVQDWFDAYVEVFAACGRGERDVDRLLEYYDVPFVLTTDAGVRSLSSEAEVLRAAQQQADAMRAADYHSSELLEAHVEVVNAVSAIYRAEFVRRDSHKNAIGRPRVTYLITTSSSGSRISALLLHST